MDTLIERSIVIENMCNNRSRKSFRVNLNKIKLVYRFDILNDNEIIYKDKKKVE